MNQEIIERLSQIARGEVPTGYQKTKVGIVPEEWEVKTISDISEKCTEKVGEQSLETLSISANRGFINQVERFGKELSGNQYEKYTVLYRGDFAYNKGNSKNYPHGCIYRLYSRNKAAVPSVFVSFRIIDEEPVFFEQLFMSGYLNRELRGKINSGVRNDGLLNLNDSEFFKCLVPLPPLPEQQKIAQILSTQDKVIQLKEKLLEQKKEQKKYLMQQLLTGKKRLEGFSGAWENTKLGQICKVQGGYAFKSDEYVKEGTIIIRISNIQDKEIDIKKASKTNEIIADSAYYVTNGDILIAMSGATTGKVGVYTLAFTSYLNQRVGKIVMIDTSFSYDFLKHWFFTNGYFNNLRNLLATGAQPNISSADLHSMQIYLPSDIKEQEAIANILTTADKEIDLLEKDVDQEKLKKKSLMQLLLTGIVRVKP